jgi:acetyl-CoA acetyltransferase
MFDHMMLDGLEDAYSRNEKTGEGRSMGTFAEECVATYQFSREDQDNFAIESVKRAQNRQQRRQLRMGSRAGERRQPPGRADHRKG